MFNCVFWPIAASRELVSRRASRVVKNLRLGVELAWAASPTWLIRYSVLGVVNAIMPPIGVWLGADLVNRIAQAQTRNATLLDLLPIVLGLWAVTTFSVRLLRTWATAVTCS
jgi:hypothetical protein